MYLFKLVFIFFWCIARRGIAGSHGSSIFSVFKKLPRCVPRWVHKFTFPPILYKGFLLSTSLPPYVIFRLFDLMIAILTAVRWYLLVILISISLSISDGQCFSMCLLPHTVSSLSDLVLVKLKIFQVLTIINSMSLFLVE